MYYRGYKRKNGLLNKKDNQDIYYLDTTDRGKILEIDLWQMRKVSNCSFKDYKTKDWFLKDRDKIKYKNTHNSYDVHIWTLFNLQRGMDTVSGKRLKINDMVIHHIKPISKGGTNTISNLILVNTDTHKLIHNNEITDNNKIKRLRNKLG